MKHFIRYGTNAEKKHIKKFLDDFDGIAFNANMVSMYAGSIANFLYENQKEYFIDPLTHAFAHNLGFLRNDKGEIKKSLAKLAEHYGIEHIILEKNRPLKLSDFDDGFLKSFFDNVVSFQENIIHENLENEWKELIEFIGFKNKPNYTIAPYFYMDRLNYKQWKNVNLEFIKLAKDKYYTQIVIEKELLQDESFIDEMVAETNQTKGVFYWIDNFDETKATEDELNSLLDFINKIQVFKVNLYGGYFSTLLNFKNLDGVIHGLEYGESRDVVPVGGGIPVAKYYLPAIKKRLKAEEIIEILFAKNITNKELFYQHICDCKKCQEITGENIQELVDSFLKIYATTKTFQHGKTLREYPITESKINSLYHYLYVKYQEFDKVEKYLLNNLLSELEEAYDSYEPIFADNFLDYLKVWQKVLNE